MNRTKLKATANKDGTMTLTDVSTSPVSKLRTTCRACHERSLTPVLSLGEQYLVNFVPAPDLNLPRSPLNLVRCDGCGLLQLDHTVNPDLLYREFWYRSSVNETMRSALKNVIQAGLNHQAGGVWLDIGANDGYLLSELPPGFLRIACEPALNFTEDLHKIADHVIADYFSANHDCLYGNTKQGRCDVITSIAMFYDLDEPDAFVRDIAKVLSPHGVWINQLNDSPTMVRANAFDAICHEHLCYYDVRSLNALYERNGLSIYDITYNDVNGGSIRVVAGRSKERGTGSLISEHRTVSALDAENFSARVQKWRDRMREQLEGPLTLGGSLWCYGASTKGCVLLQYLDMPGTFKAIADRNPIKFGTYMTGTWLPVTNEQDMRDEHPRNVLVLPWSFKKEFVERERKLMDEGTTLVFPLPSIEQVF